MAKLLLLLVIVVAAVWLLRRPRSLGPGAAQRRQQQPPAQPVVECVHCGLHLPRDDAVEDAAGRLFCSEAHRLAGSPRAGG